MSQPRIKGGGRLKRVNIAPHGTLVHRKRPPQRPKMPIICQIELRNPSYGGGLLPPHRMHVRDKRSPVIAIYFCASAREAGYGDLLLIPSSRALLRGDLHFITIVGDLAVRTRARSGDRHDHGEQ